MKKSRAEEAKKFINEVSPTFCLAKWATGTVHLQHGLVNSCCHAIPTLSDEEEVKKNPAALFNNKEELENRQGLLDGKQIDSCYTCWEVENVDSGVYSERTIMSSYDWTWENKEKIVENGISDTTLPVYLEVDFGFHCNLKCTYCSPFFSSQWFSEIKKHGDYPTTDDHHFVPEKNLNNPRYTDMEFKNPFVDAFWEWWPELVEGLHTFRITGGEPLLNPNTFRMLDFLIENPQPHLELCINTNMCIRGNKLDEFMDKLKIIEENNCLRHFCLYTSMDADGDRAEFIRFGLDLDLFWENCNTFAEQFPKYNLRFITAFSCLSATSYLDFLKRLSNFKEKHTTFENRITVDINPVLNPYYLSIKMLISHFEKEIQEIIDYVESNDNFGFIEKEKVKTLQSNIESNPPQQQVMFRDFYRFMTEFERRNNVKFLDIFPEYESFVRKAHTAAEFIIASDKD